MSHRYDSKEIARLVFLRILGLNPVIGVLAIASPAVQLLAEAFLEFHRHVKHLGEIGITRERLIADVDRARLRPLFDWLF